MLHQFKTVQVYTYTKPQFTQQEGALSLQSPEFMIAMDPYFAKCANHPITDSGSYNARSLS